MKRRTFVNAGVLGLGAVPFVGFRALGGLSGQSKPEWILDWIKVQDAQMSGYELLRVTEPSHRFFGAYTDQTEIPNPHSTAGFIAKSCMLMSVPESIYYESKIKLEEVEVALKALLAMQHEDGTIDLLSTNFHSTPDTAFVIETILPAYKFLGRLNRQNNRASLKLLEKFIKNAGEALIIGGIHTPNHRWVVSAALTRINELFPDRRYEDRIEQWLAEHIDLDPDGQYTEKSTNGYSPIVNRSLITMAIGLNKPELLEPVRKNLMMTLYYVHPNGEVVTEASNRQDRGTIDFMYKYYYCYRYMALKDNNGKMAAMCRLIEKTCSNTQLAVFLPYFLENQTLWQELTADKPLPTDYARAFPYSGVVRIRRGNWDCTLLSNNTSWLTFHKGNAVLQAMRVAASFFGKGQFQSDEVEERNGNWFMTRSLEGPYYQPLEEDKISSDGDLSKMPRDLRIKSEIQNLETRVSVREHSTGVEVDIEILGTDGVPVSLELIFRPGGVLKGLKGHGDDKNAYLLSQGNGTYSMGNDTIQFGPGKVEHKALVLRGALPRMNAPTAYITGFTPFKHTLKLS
ncbi:hypothetical protein LAG90_17995 [Marinilongibacter aquaticus]|uniref:hypothetical protein n=1 Tax=Marinilongibacter aquaticus TaxID=2975157 RepID=UPI0021BD5131|nr:hypothetical protein [Marinilongibacter aquaticus]UBM58694.1 hypothetical protein LAG90_17995 [Marinilongibacter aquaticus]